MKYSSRGRLPIVKKAFFAIDSLLKLTYSALKREITLKQFILDISFRLIPQSRILNDDFDWNKYPSYYNEELKSTSRVHTLLIKNNNFEFINDTLVKKDLKAKDLHPNHEILYTSILLLAPKSILEVGCGGGDHLSNINELDKDIELYGIDRSYAQLQTLHRRHPDLNAKTSVVDVTEKNCIVNEVELVFTQAVLMHISETDGRFQTALNCVFSSAKRYVVLVENWSQHDFLSEIRNIQNMNPQWSKSFIYFAKSTTKGSASALIVSKKEVKGLTALTSYDQLLEGKKLLIH